MIDADFAVLCLIVLLMSVPSPVTVLDLLWSSIFSR